MDAHRLTANLLKALAHPIRLQILRVLQEEGEACVCHMEARLRKRQAYISQQLAKLREVGLVTDRREGLNVFYALSAGGVEDLLEQARRLAAVAAGLDEAGIRFADIRKIPPERCSCPKCEQALRGAGEMLSSEEYPSTA